MKEEFNQNHKTIILCGRGKCCPKITHHNTEEENHIIISDDHNGSVKLTIRETKELREAISKLLD